MPPHSSLPNAGIVADQIRRQRTAGRKQPRTAAVVAMRINRRHVFDLLEAVHFFFGELWDDSMCKDLLNSNVPLLQRALL